MLQLIRRSSEYHSTQRRTSKAILPDSEMGGHEDAKRGETEPEPTSIDSTDFVDSGSGQLLKPE